MPVDCELLSGSPPLYRNMPSLERRLVLHRSQSYTLSMQSSMLSALSKSPSRSCLAVKTSQSNGFIKKGHRVQFADEKGYSLYTVRVIKEPSECPPKLSEDVLASVLADASYSVKKEEPWVLAFTQPAAVYLEFREKLASRCIALENVILRDLALLGTIKVKNLAFDKQVGVRVTFDGWQSFVDIPASYVKDGATKLGNSKFDTFSFEVHIQPETDRESKIEFCVFFRCEGQEYWDSNEGKNFVLVPTNVKQEHSLSMPIPKSPHTDTVLTSCDSYTEFAVWNCSDTVTPYW